jgi:hypothetical protein
MGFGEWLRGEDGMKQQADFFRFWGPMLDLFLGMSQRMSKLSNYHVTYLL